MHLRLRWKILLFTVPPLLVLAFGALWMVNASVSRQVQVNVRADLKRASAVFEDMLAARTRELAVAGQVIVQDPRFFSVLTLPGTPHDSQLRATVSGVAHEFNRITSAELFEVVDAHNRTLASVGHATVNESSRADLVRAALAGRPVTGVMIDADRHYLASVTPVSAGGKIVGALLVGDGIGRDLALKLRALTRSEVTFLCGRTITGTTLAPGGAEGTALGALGRLRTGNPGLGNSGHVFDLVEAGHSYLTIVAAIPGSNPRSGQFYVLQRSLDGEIAALRRMQRGLLALGLCAAIIALLSGLLVAEKVTSPLRRLVRGAEEMEKGNYDYDLHIRSRDEVGYLTARFLEMRQQQRAYVRSLQEVARVKSEFISVASHELRTPISIISCYHELMAAGQIGPVSAAQQQALVAIGESVVRLTQIAENATYMAQIDSQRLVLNRGEHEVRELVGCAVAAAQASAPERNVRLETEIARDLEPVEVDGAQITQAVLQLVCNGIRFTPDGGTVTVRASQDAGCLVIEVEDTGVGIPEDRRDRIFDRAAAFGDPLHHHSSNRLDFNSAGLGLGLSIAHGIILAHGGEILVDS